MKLHYTSIFLHNNNIIETDDFPSQSKARYELAPHACISHTQLRYIQ